MIENKHLHIFERLRGKGGTNIRYRCLHPECTSIFSSEILEGKKALCSICKEKELIITREDLRRKHFRCLECSNTREAEKKRKVIDKIAVFFSDDIEIETNLLK